MVSVSEVSKAWNEGFKKKDSSPLAEFFTDDFQFVGGQGSRSRQETLDWIAAGGSPTSIDNLEVLFENDDVAVYINGANDGVAMCFYTKRGGKFSHCRVVVQVA